MQGKKIMEKLLAIQTELHVPKNQVVYNKGTKQVKYRYRSAEDILEAIKPLSKKYNVLFKINEKIIKFDDEFALISTIKIFDVDNPSDSIETDAITFLDLFSGFMSKPQHSGAGSSYGKKYALGNLLLIDDTRDEDAITNDGKIQLTENSDKLREISMYIKKNKKMPNLSRYEISQPIMSKLNAFLEKQLNS